MLPTLDIPADRPYTVCRYSEWVQADFPPKAKVREMVRGWQGKVEEAMQEGSIGKHKEIKHKETQSTALAVSLAQEQMLLLHSMQPRSTAYSVPLCVSFRGALSVAALRQSIEWLVARHEVLRTRYVRETEGATGTAVWRPVVVGTAEYELEMRTDDVRYMEAGCGAERSRAGVRVAAKLALVAEAGRSFDLEAGPVMRAQLVRAGAEEHVLMLNVHHVATDEWSEKVLMRELAVAYGAFEEGEAPTVEAAAVRYTDYAAWQREWLGAREGVERERQLAYWRETLRGAPTVLELPTDRSRPTVQSHEGGVARLEVHGEVVARLRQQAASAGGVSLFMALLAAWHVLLARYSRSEEVVIGSPIAGRLRPEVQDVVGYFVNVLALRVGGDQHTATVGEVLRRARDCCVGAYAHADVPFHEVVRELDVARDTSRTPLFQAMLVLEDDSQSARVKAGGVSMEEVLLHQVCGDGGEEGGGGAEKEEVAGFGSAKFDVLLRARESGRGGSAHKLELLLEYCSALLEPASAARMVRHFGVLLRGMVLHDVVTTRVKELPMIDAEERRQVLVDWNATTTEAPLDKCVHELLEEQAGRTPRALAAVGQEGSVTYAELDARINRLARHLVSLGVGAESLVGVCLERSVRILVAIHAILRAGGAYVPIEPSFPRQRVAFMADDCGMKLVVTESAAMEAVSGLGAEVEPVLVVLDAEETASAVGGESSDALRGRRSSPRNAAYAIFTSGTTGRPKGVLVEHRGLVNDIWFVVTGARMLQTEDLRMSLFASV